MFPLHTAHLLQSTFYQTMIRLFLSEIDWITRFYYLTSASNKMMIRIKSRSSFDWWQTSLLSDWTRFLPQPAIKAFRLGADKITAMTEISSRYKIILQAACESIQRWVFFSVNTMTDFNFALAAVLAFCLVSNIHCLPSHVNYVQANTPENSKPRHLRTWRQRYFSSLIWRSSWNVIFSRASASSVRRGFGGRTERTVSRRHRHNPGTIECISRWKSWENRIDRHIVSLEW